jgi:hypothetical protein
MLRWVLLGWLLPLVTPLPAQYDSKQPLTAEIILIGRAQHVVSEMLRSMPNFTCVETIERSQRAPNTKKYQLIDTIRLEVALVEGKELYAWPGSAKFEEADVTKLVGGLGAIGTGDFALHAKSIFLTGQARFKYLGVVELEGKPAHKFHFHVPMGASRYWMKISGVEGEVGYQGHVWHDKESLDLLRIEMTIDEIPAHIPLRGGHKLIDYARLPIGDRTYVLPVGMDMTLSGVQGGESRNKTVFSRCKQYSGESTLIFEEPSPDAKPLEAQVVVTLPKNLAVSMKLAETIDLSKAATGDAVRFEVSRNSQRDGVVIVPKGAHVDARLDQVVCRDYPFAHCYVAIVPLQISFENKTGAFQATLETPSLERTMQTMFTNLRPDQRLPPAEIGMAAKGSSLLLLRGNRPKLTSGYSMVWRTLEARGDQ